MASSLRRPRSPSDLLTVQPCLQQKQHASRRGSRADCPTRWRATLPSKVVPNSNRPLLNGHLLGPPFCNRPDWVCRSSTRRGYYSDDGFVLPAPHRSSFIEDRCTASTDLPNGQPQAGTRLFDHMRDPTTCLGRTRPVDVYGMKKTTKDG